MSSYMQASLVHLLGELEAVGMVTTMDHMDSMSFRISEQS